MPAHTAFVVHRAATHALASPLGLCLSHRAGPLHCPGSSCLLSAFAKLFPPPVPQGGGRGATCPLRPPTLPSPNSQLRIPTRSGGGGRGFASSPRPASPAFAPEITPMLEKTPPVPQRGKPGGNLPPATPDSSACQNRLPARTARQAAVEGLSPSRPASPAFAPEVTQPRAGIGQTNEVTLAPLRRGRAGVPKLPPPCIPRLR